MFGQLGYENTLDIGTFQGTEPFEAGTLEIADPNTEPDLEVVQLAAGGWHNCVLLNEVNAQTPPSHLRCWGRNHCGQLGYEDTGTRGSAGGTMPLVDVSVF
jgi:hypothetical protein